MASRAHVVPHYDYDLDRGSERPRRQVLYRSSEDPIVIPRGRSRDGGGLAIVISALIATSVILGGAYALYVGPAPTLAVTPTLPLNPTWQQDSQPQQAMVERALQGPALAVADTATPGTLQRDITDPEPRSTPVSSPPEAPRAPTSSSPEVVIDDRYQLPQPAPQAPTAEPAPYPDPVKTPPDGVGPTLDMSAPTPAMDPENPYRD